jgi:hypothetical protein
MRHHYEFGLRSMIALAIIFVAGYVTESPRVAAQGDSPASVTINVHTCGDLHDPIDPNQTLANECALGTEDIAFTLEPIAPQGGGMMASTGSGGSPATISFSQLAPGQFRLSQDTPGTIALSYVASCTSSVRTFEYPFTPFATIEPEGRLNIELLAGEQLSCDWYNILAPEQETAATLTVTVYSCSGDVIDPELCDLAPDVDLRLFGPSAEIVITSDASGIATFDGEGEFQLEAVSDLEDRDFCGFHTGSGDTTSTLTLDTANPLALDAYYCYPGA